MRSKAPIREPAGNAWSGEWLRWLQGVYDACTGWNQSKTTAALIDFPNIAAGGQQASAAIALTGVRLGDAVQAFAPVDVAGVIFTGAVTADNFVTLYAKNYSTGAVNPAPQTFRIIVLQQ